MARKSFYSIRSATKADAAEIARLASQLGYPAAAGEILGRLESLLDRPNHFIAVAAAEKQPRLLGWIAAEERNLLITSKRVEIMGLVVDHSLRREGVGHTLVTEVERWAVKRGVGEVVVHSNIRRPESHPFYEQLGYHREKSQHVYLKQPV
ncbi:MAG TPA: GNAT family N-acetyltransferase [Chthoniobacterales bacterium]